MAAWFNPFGVMGSTRLKFALLAVLGLAACAPPTPTAPVRVEIRVPVTRFTLPNGLEVVVQEDHRTPHVAVNLRYHSGSKNDPPGRAGMAHLVEHLQFVESQHTKRDEFFRTMVALGARDVNGTTDVDGTSYFETVPSSSLESVLWIEADRMASARLGWSDDAIEREKNVVAQELRLRFDNEPNGLRHQLLSRGVYPQGHPYRQALAEEAQERAATRAELVDFAARAYGPDNATLMLVGDVTAPRAKELAAQYFGAVAPRASRFDARLVAPVERAAYKRLDIVADVDEPTVYVAWPLPAPTDDGFYEAGYAISILTGYASYNAQDKHGSLRPGSVHWLVVPHRLGSIGIIYGTPTKDAAPDDLLDSIDISRQRIVARELGTLGAYRSFYIATEVRAAENLDGRAKRMQELLELYGEPDVMRDLRAVQAVTKSRMVGAVDKFLDPARAVVVVVTPNHDAPRAGRVVSEVPR